MGTDDGPFGGAGLAAFLFEWLPLITRRWGTPFLPEGSSLSSSILASWGEVFPGPWIITAGFFEDFVDLVLFCTSVVDPKLANAL
jgi:hypothetical protein